MEEIMSGSPVVVGVDGSEYGLHAARVAAVHAARRRLPLVILRVLEWPFADMPVQLEVPSEQELRRRGEHDLDDATIGARAAADDFEIRSHIVTGSAASVLVQASTRAALLVVGAHGRSRLADALAGSVTVQVATHAHCPVLVVRGDTRPGADVVLGADGSPGGAAAIPYAFDEAAACGVGLTAVRAWRHPVSAGPDMMPPAIVDQHHAAVAAALEEDLTESRKAHPDVPVHQRIVGGSAKRALIEASGSGQLVVVGARGHGGFAGLRLGSVGLALVHQADCPVAIIRT